MDSNYTKAGYLTEPFKIFHLRDEHKLNIDFHYHDFHKILIHLHGNVSYCIEGRSYELKEHDIVLVNAGEVHKPILNDDSIYERIIIYVSQQLIDDYVSKGYDLACCFKQAYANQSHVLRLAATKGSRLADTIKGLDSTLRETNEYANELYQKLLFLEFLIQLNRITLHGGIEYINTFSSNKKIVEILDFLNKDLTNRISIDELADKFYMSRYHLMHTFKEETGCTIGSYITTKRLLLARDMIRDGSSVSAACDACGFEAIPHLSAHTASNSILPLQIHKSFTIYHRKLLIIFNAALSLINHIYKLRYELLLTRHYSLKHNSIPALWQIVR